MADTRSGGEVVVIGAGIIGCAIAFELARRGVPVSIVDDRPPGMGATQASAGVLAPYIEAGAGSALLDLTERSLRLFDRFVADTESVSSQPVAYQRTGTIDVALHDDALRRLQATALALNSRGVTARMLDAAQLRVEEPHLSAEALGGLHIPDHGYVGALDLTRALAGAARRHGATFLEVGRARRIAPSPRGTALAVTAERGVVTAATVVLAAGSWAGQIAIDGVDTTIPVKPIRGQLLQLAWPGTPLKRVTWSDRCYLVPWSSGTLLVGATVEDAGFDESTTLAGVRDLIEAACELVPHAWRAGVTGARAGLRPGTTDDLPVIGRSAVLPNLIYAAGHYRNGVLLAPLTAQLVAALCLDDRSDAMLEVTSPQRFGRL